MQPTRSTSTSVAAKPGPSRPTGGSGPVKPPVVLPGTGNNIIVNSCQRGNPVLECVRNVGKEFGDIVADYQVGRTTGVLFLSMKYHRLHPEYIHQRIERLGTSYNLRILLIMCDVSEHQDPIRELTKTCLINNITVMVSWTPEEAGYYLSVYKQFEHKPPDLIKERVDKDYNSMLRSALTSISKVNKTDVEILRTSVGSFADIAKMTSEQLLQLPGFGQVKVRRMRDAFEKPFRNKATGIIPFASQHQLPQERQNTAITGSAAATDKGKGKAKETTRATPAAPPPREPSPMWDIELDLNDYPSPDLPPVILPDISSNQANNSRKRPPSPVWDLELDLNDSDTEDNPSKRQKVGSPGGQTGDKTFAPTRLL